MNSIQASSSTENTVMVAVRASYIIFKSSLSERKIISPSLTPSRLDLPFQKRIQCLYNCNLFQSLKALYTLLNKGGQFHTSVSILFPVRMLHMHNVNCYINITIKLTCVLDKQEQDTGESLLQKLHQCVWLAF